MAAHQKLRSFKNEDYPQFLNTAVTVFKRREDSNFTQILIQLLREDDPCLRQILFSKDMLTLDEAAQLVRSASRLDPGFQVHLVGAVKTEIDKAGANVRSEDLARILEMLATTIDASRLIPFLSKLCQHNDDRLRSKAVLLTGRLAKKINPNSELMKDLDPRVRANAVEALWGRNDEDSLNFFKEATRDPHHRVAANAWLALYKAGDLTGVQGISRMAMDREIPRQLAGIWAIGQTQDPRFNSLIQNMLEAGIGRLKFGLLKAARSLKQRRDDLQAKPPLSLPLISFEREDNGTVRLSFLAQSDKQEILPQDQVLATNFVIFDGELRVDNFRFATHGGKLQLNAGFLIPMRKGVEQAFATQLVSAMELSISGKRRSDSWAIHKYEVNQSADGTPLSVDFTPQSDALRADQLRSAKGASPDLASGVEKLLLSFPMDSYAKHMVILLDPDLANHSLPPDQVTAWIERAKRFQISVHVVLCGDPKPENIAPWKQLARERDGYFMHCEHPGELPLSLRSLCLGLQSSYEISYRLGRIGQPASIAHPIRVELHCSRGIGVLSLDQDGYPITP